MDILSFLVPNPEPSVVAEPRQGSFDHPAVASQLLAGVDVLAGDPDLDPVLGKSRSVSGKTQRLCRREASEGVSGTAPWPSNRSDSVDPLFEDGRVVSIASGETKR